MKRAKISVFLCALLLAFALIFTACGNTNGADNTVSGATSSEVTSDVTEQEYQEAVNLLNSGKYTEAYEKFLSIKDEKDVSKELARFVWVLTEEKYTNSTGTYNTTTKYVCDDKGNVQQEIQTASNGNTTTSNYYYAADGKLSEIRREMDGYVSWSVKYSYNANGSISKEVYTTEAFGEYSHQYSYDANGHLIEIKYGYPESPYTVGYEYDALGRLVEEKKVYAGPIASTTVIKYSYGTDGVINGGEISYQDPNGTTVTQQEYKNGLLIKETAHYYDGDVVTTYEYNEYGNRTKMKADTTYEYSYTLYYRSEA